jgi:hypothetical protein
VTGRLALALALALALFLALVPAAAVARGAAGPPAQAPTIAAQIAVTAGFSALDGRSECSDPSSDAKMLFLTIHNQGNAPLSIRDIRLLAPGDLKLCPREGGAAIRVEAGRRHVVPLRVAVNGVPRQGATTLILEVALAADIGGAERVDTLLATQNVEIRIPGLSDALKLLGVPTLLLLPGVLTLTALFFMFTPAGESRWVKLKPPGPGFWMVAIPVSLALSWAYGRAMGWIGFPRDLSDRFDLWDIGVIWFVSILLGGVAGWQIQAAKTRRDNSDRAVVARRTLRGDDKPLALFERLLLLGGFDKAPQWYRLAVRSGFLINPKGGQSRWLVPQAVPRTAKPAPVEKATWDAALIALAALIAREASLTDLVAFLREQDRAGLDLIMWRDDVGPLELDEADRPDPQNDRYYYVAGL